MRSRSGSSRRMVSIRLCRHMSLRAEEIQVYALMGGDGRGNPKSNQEFSSSFG